MVLVKPQLHKGFCITSGPMVFLNNVNAKPLFRLRNGFLVKRYTDEIPEWAKLLL